MASICPILSVLITGLWVQLKRKRIKQKSVDKLQSQEGAL